MVGQLVASQFQTAQNWALGSAMAVLLILVITATIAVGAAIVWLIPLPFRRRNRLVLGDAPRAGRSAAPPLSASCRESEHDRFARPRSRRRPTRAPLVVGRRARRCGACSSSLFLFAPIIVIIVSSFNIGRLLVAWDGFGFDAFLAIVAKPAMQSAVLVSIQHRPDRGGLRDAARHPCRHRDGTASRQMGLLVPRPAAARLGHPRDRRCGRAAAVARVPRAGPRHHASSATASCAWWSATRCSRPRSSRTSCGRGSWVWTRSSRRHRPTSTRSRSRRSAGSRCRSRCRPCWPASCSSFTLSLDNTIVAAFVQVSGTTPWPVYVLSALRIGPAPEIAAVSTIMLLLTLVALAAGRARAQARGRLGDPDRPHAWPAADAPRPHLTPSKEYAHALCRPRLHRRTRVHRRHRALTRERRRRDGRPHRRRRRRRRARPDRPGDRGRRPGGADAAARASRTRTCIRSGAGSTCCAATSPRCTTERRVPRAHRGVRGGASRTTSGSSAAAGRCRRSPAERRPRRRSTASSPTARRSSPTATGTAPGSTPRRCAAPASTATRPTRPTAASSATPTATPSGTLHEGAMTLVNRLLPEIGDGRADRGAPGRPAVPALVRHHRLAGRDHRRLRRRRAIPAPHTSRPRHPVR